MSGACAGWWVTATVAVPLVTLPWTAPRAAPAGAETSLVALSAATLLAAASWLLILLMVELAAALGAWADPRDLRTRLPAQAVVAGLVALVLGGAAAPATATSEQLPAPDREPDAAATVLVRSGDTLWNIADLHLHHGEGSPASVLRSVQRLHLVNRAVIGSDPDRIHPGTRLRLPTHREDRP